MSRLARKAIPIPQGVTVKVSDGVVVVHGQKGEVTCPVLNETKVAVGEGGVKVDASGTSSSARMMSGTMWAHLRNAIEGVTKGFSKTLEIVGVGYRASMEGKTIVLNLGFTNPVRFTPPEGVTILVEKNVITISGIDKTKVGQASAEIRAMKPPEPYKGKGIKYQGEVIRRKAGKKAVASGS